MNNIPKKDEPRNIYGRSAQSEYAIEHPLKGKLSSSPNSTRALELFLESVQHLQDGDELNAPTLLQEALKTDPSLHSHACEALVNNLKSCRPEDEGAIYYWLGIHTQYQNNLPQAENWYAKAIDIFHRIGYSKREGRARCNLGRVKMELEDPTGFEEFEKAIALNPMDGIAHIDIGTVYFFADDHERALDAFAEAVWADPDRYGPVVFSRLQRFGYTWKEDVKKIGQRLAKKQGIDPDTISEGERENILKAYHYYEIGNGSFRSGRYKEALEQFEMGKLLTSKFPGNYFGVSMTIMQMIEVGAISMDQFPFYLEKAEQNIDQCLRIAPTNPLYHRTKIIIGEYKKKYHVA